MVNIFYLEEKLEGNIQYKIKSINIFQVMIFF